MWHTGSLTFRFVALFVLIALGFTLILFYAINSTASRMATEQTISDAVGHVDRAAATLDHLFSGRDLIAGFTTDPRLQSQDEATRQEWLDHARLVSHLFDQFALLDAQMTLLNVSPREGGLAELVGQPGHRLLIQRALETREVQITPAFAPRSGDPFMAFLAPVYDRQGSPFGVLAGGIALGRNYGDESHPR